MEEKDTKLINYLLGKDFFEELTKSEISGGIIKQNTKTATDINEIKIALQIVPRAILSYLFHHLKTYKIGDAIDLDLPFANARLMANKYSPDNYSGEIIQDGKRLAEFKYRSLPGIGLIIMSTFELYDIDQLKNSEPKDIDNCQINKLQEMIDERIKLNHLIESVVSNKLSEREAINQLINDRLNQHIIAVNSITSVEEELEEVLEEETEENEFIGSEIIDCDIKEDIIESEEEHLMEQPKECKLKQFLNNKKNKEVNKSQVRCNDCKTPLYKGGEQIILCLCYGEFMGKSIKIEKNDKGNIKLKFPKGINVDNLKMLLDNFKKD